MDATSFFSSIDWPSTLVGAFAGCIVAWLLRNIVLFFKPSRERFHISLIKLDTEKKYKSISQDDIDISIKYKGEVFDGELAVVTIRLKNDGINHISYVNHFDAPILLKSKDYKIIDASLLGSPLAKADVQLLDNGSVSIKWGILKKGESIDIQIIGQKKYTTSVNEEQNSLFSSLRFSVRSDCVDSIRQPRVNLKDWLVFITLSILSIAAIHIIVDSKKEIPQYTFDVNNFSYTGTLDYNPENGHLIINSPDSRDVNHSRIDFKKKPTIIIKKGWNQTLYFIIVYSSFWFFSVLLVLVFEFYERKKERKTLLEEIEMDTEPNEEE